jgi:hypothetical protein
MKINLFYNKISFIFVPQLRNNNMRNTIYYKWFIESLTPDQKEHYNSLSINEQKDWYISFLEDSYLPKK